MIAFAEEATDFFVPCAGEGAALMIAAGDIRVGYEPGGILMLLIRYC